MRMMAIPVRDDGTEYIGTEGVRSGDYQSVRNFVRYNVSHRNKWDRSDTYNVYRVYQARFTLLQTVTMEGNTP